MKTTRLACTTIALAATIACHHAPPPPPRAAAPPPPTGATAQTPMGQAGAADEPLQIRWVRVSAEYEALVRQAFRVAEAHVEREARSRAAGTWGVVLDADETVISNLTQQVEQQGKKYDPDAWTAWVKRRQATALPGAKAFLAHVHELGGRIVIVTNRRAAVCDDTKAVFAAQGLVYDEMLCRTDAEDKNPRFDAVAKGTPPSTLGPLAIVAFLGDNIKDFPGLSQAIQGQDAAYADVGTRFFVLPNPMYGSWEAR
jgi:5'-nucleotidase (lipoprotein e(P4) family)